MRALAAMAGRLFRMSRPITYVAGILLLAFIGLLFKDGSFGRVAIIVYGCIALITGGKSSDTFQMAIIALVCTVGLSIVSNADLAGNFAQYAFLLLCFGVLLTFREQWRVNHAEKVVRGIKRI